MKTHTHSTTKLEAQKPYTTPSLTVHGTVDQLTKGAGLLISDTVISGSVV